MSASNNQPALSAESLRKRYRRGWLRRAVWALDGVDLAIPAGGVTAVVGPNGAGKSTLIRSWVGFERPTRGKALVFGADPRGGGNELRQRVGYVAQVPALYDELTVDDHLTLAERVRPGFDRRSAADRLGRLRVSLDARGDQLSGGERAQVALSLALAAGADVLLLDEPLAHLDPLARRDFLSVVRNAASNGLTIILSSHIVSDIEEACDGLIVLGAGRVLLHMRIEEALAAHWVMPMAAHGVAGFVATFPSDDGDATLLRSDGADSGRRATLEEVVLGYLGAARAIEAGSPR